MNDEDPSARALAAALAERLLARLARREPPALPLPREERVRDALRAGAVDDGLRAAVLAAASAAVLDPLVDAALAEDAAEVLLPDGTRLDRSAAERLLAGKEERRAYPPLRDALDDAMSEARGRSFAALGRVLDERAREQGLTLQAEIGDVEKAREEMRALLAATTDAGHAAREALAVLGGAPVSGRAGLSRGLDLPDPAGAFSDDAATALARAARSAADRHVARPLKRLIVPRAMAGLVVAAAPGAVRVGAAPCARAGRFAALVRGGGAGLCLSLVVEEELSTAVEEAAFILGEAVALGLWSAPVRRAVLGEGRSAADRAGRIGAATWLLEVRVAAALAESLLGDEGSDDALREALVRALGDDPGTEALRRAARPPLPGGLVLGTRAAARLREARAAVRGAAAALRLRASDDAVFPLRPGFAALLAHGAPGLASGGHTVSDLLSLEGAGPADLVAWIGEAL